MNYQQAIAQLIKRAPEGTAISISALVGANVVDKLYPNRLGTTDRYFTFDGDILDMWEIIAPAFPDSGVELKPPQLNFFDSVVLVSDIEGTVLAKPFVINDLGATLYLFGGYVPDTALNILKNGKDFYMSQEYKSVFETFNIRDLIATLHDNGVYVLLDPVGQYEYDRAAEKGMQIWRGNFKYELSAAVAQNKSAKRTVIITESVKETVEAVQPAVVLEKVAGGGVKLFGAAPMFFLGLGAIGLIFLATKTAVTNKITQAVE